MTIEEIERDPKRVFNCQDRQAILLLEKLEREGRGVPHRLQKKLSSREICSWFDGDHVWRHELGGPTHPSNGQMLLSKKGTRRLSWILGLEQKAEHKDKTRRDVKEIAKGRKIKASQAAFRAKILAKTQPEADVSRETSQPRSRWGKGKIPSRPFQKGHRPLRRAR